MWKNRVATVGARCKRKLAEPVVAASLIACRLRRLLLWYCHGRLQIREFLKGANLQFASVSVTGLARGVKKYGKVDRLVAAAYSTCILALQGAIHGDS